MSKSLIGKATKQFSKFDLFGKPVEITVLGEGANKTFIGAIVSIFCLTLSIYLTVPTFDNFMKSVNPTVVTSYEYDTSSIKMNEKNFYFSVGFYYYLSGTKLELSNSTNNYTALINTSDIQLSCNDCGFNITSNYYDTYYNETLGSKSNSTNTTTTTTSNRRRFTESSNTTDSNSSSSSVDNTTNSTNTTVEYSNVTGWKKPTSVLAKSLLEQQLDGYKAKNISNSTFYLVSCRSEMFQENMRIKSISKLRSQDIAEILRTYSFCFPEVFESELTDGSDSGYDQTLSAQLEYKKVEYIPEELKGMFTIEGAVDPSTGK